MYRSKHTLEFLNLECYFVLLSCWPKKQQNILTTIVLTFTNLIHFNKWWPKMLMAIYHFVFWHEQEFLFFSSPCHISLYEERKLGYSLPQQKTLLWDLQTKIEFVHCKVRYTNIAKAMLYTIALGGHSQWNRPKNIL